MNAYLHPIALFASEVFLAGLLAACERGVRPAKAVVIDAMVFVEWSAAGFSPIHRTATTQSNIGFTVDYPSILPEATFSAAWKAFSCLNGDERLIRNGLTNL